MNYGLALDLEALRFLLSLSSSKRKRLLDWLELLKATPFLRGELSVLDSTGREIQVSSIDHFLVYHWTDHAVKSVQVLKIEMNS